MLGRRRLKETTMADFFARQREGTCGCDCNPVGELCMLRWSRAQN